jgi:hypothetical protein
MRPDLVDPKEVSEVLCLEWGVSGSQVGVGSVISGHTRGATAWQISPGGEERGTSAREIVRWEKRIEKLCPSL